MEINLQPNYVDTYIIIAISFIFLLLFYAWVFFKKYKEPSPTSVYLQCAAGVECATSMLDGSKRCPLNSTESILYDPKYEVCNLRDGCNNSITPYALQGDLSTNDLGVCPEDTSCSCLTAPQCAVYTTVLWTVANGSIYSDTADQVHLTFAQTSGSSQGSNQPIKYTDPNTQFCGLQGIYLNRITPGACVFPDETISLDQMTYCVQSNPCISGVLAFNPLNADDFILTSEDTGAITNIPLICTPGGLTPKGTSSECYLPYDVPVFDRRIGEIRCYDTSTGKLH